MRKINIKDILLDIDMVQVLNSNDAKKTIYIDIDGNIYDNKEDTNNKAIIYQNLEFDKFSHISDAKALANEIFAAYKPTMIGTICKIKPLNNWQNIIDLNKNEMLYFDHQSDGVEIFEDKELEEFGWQATPLEIKYRELSDFIENNCEGTLLFYDNEIQFSGFAIVNDIQKTREEVKGFIITKAKENISENLVELDDDDVIEALEFFNIEE